MLNGVKHLLAVIHSPLIDPSLRSGWQRKFKPEVMPNLFRHPISRVTYMMYNGPVGSWNKFRMTFFVKQKPRQVTCRGFCFYLYFRAKR